MMLLRYSVLIMVILAIACTSKPDRPEPILDQNRINAANASAQTTASNTIGNVQHYYCPNNCAGSGGDAQGVCPVCGTQYEHNQAWHNQQNAVTTTSSTVDVGSSANNIAIPSGTTAGANAIANAAGVTPPEPPQNAAGVWHYICPNGHAGGAGGASACSECGTTLVHNQAYHN